MKILVLYCQACRLCFSILLSQSDRMLNGPAQSRTTSFSWETQMQHVIGVRLTAIGLQPAALPATQRNHRIPEAHDLPMAGHTLGRHCMSGCAPRSVQSPVRRRPAHVQVPFVACRMPRLRARPPQTGATHTWILTRPDPARPQLVVSKATTGHQSHSPLCCLRSSMRPQPGIEHTASVMPLVTTEPRAQPLDHVLPWRFQGRRYT